MSHDIITAPFEELEARVQYPGVARMANGSTLAVHPSPDGQRDIVQSVTQGPELSAVEGLLTAPDFLADIHAFMELYRLPRACFLASIKAARPHFLVQSNPSHWQAPPGARHARRHH